MTEKNVAIGMICVAAAFMLAEFVAISEHHAVKFPQLGSEFAQQLELSIRETTGDAMGHKYPACNLPPAANTNPAASPADVPLFSPICIIAVGRGALQSATTMQNTIAIGECSGASLTTESRDLLIGDYTAAPKGKNGFVNIGNQVCFWRDSGTVVPCPPPEPPCAAADSASTAANVAH